MSTERTLVNMQLLGIQQYFIDRWCHQRLEKFQHRHFTNFACQSHVFIKGTYYIGKHWWFKNWRTDGFSPNSPMLEPSKVSLRMVINYIFYCKLWHSFWVINQLSQGTCFLGLTAMVLQSLQNCSPCCFKQSSTLKTYAFIYQSQCSKGGLRV